MVEAGMDATGTMAAPGRRARAALVVLSAAASLAACAGPRYASNAPSPAAEPSEPGQALHGTDKPYQIRGRWYYPKAEPHYDEVGLASWYGAAEHNRHTADGEMFDQFGLSAAHRTLPLPSIVEVTNLANGRTIRLRLNDRGPFVDGRLIDLSRGAAQQLGFDRQGLARVRVRYVSPAPPLAAQGVMQARLTPRRMEILPPPAPPPQLSAAPETDAPVAVEGSDYRVQLGAYSTRDEALRAAAQLGEDIRYVIEPVRDQGDARYRVVLGGFLDEDDALAAQLRFAEAGYPQARVLRPF
ncbi:MAG TPA: septal ring lytic transglycosylase RlpA family protein [Caulobacteraceae bacterium]|jgi:rare lipoprotein A|nr:septal ring lytic transglycosylase RlpA family protein [Caulobacteraceae bacterium]